MTFSSISIIFKWGPPPAYNRYGTIAFLCATGQFNMTPTIKYNLFRSLGTILQLVSYESYHGKTDLKVFVVVIPKEGLVDGLPHKSFCMTSTIDL